MTGTHKKIRGLLLAALMVTSVFTGAIAFAGTAAAEESLEDGGVYFSGQTLNYSNGVQDGDTFVLRQDGDFEREIEASGSSINLSTEKLGEGKYTLTERGNTSNNVSFEIVEQDLSATVSDGTLTVDSARSGYFVNASVDGLTDNETQALLNTSDAEGTELLEVTGNNRDFDLNRTAVPEGSYTIAFEVNDTGATATTTVNVGAADGVDAEFDRSVYEGTRGDLTEMTLELTDTDTAQVQVGSDDVNYNVSLEAADNDGDGEVTVVFNTYNSTTNASEAFSAEGSDDVTVLTPNVSTPSQRILDATDYDLSASVGGEETDVATLVLNEGSIDSLEIGTMPGDSFGDADSVSEVENMTTERSDVASGDVVVHRHEATGIYGAVEAYGSFDALLANTDAEIVIEESQAEANADPASISLENLDSGAYEVYADSDEGVVYVNVDSSQLPSNLSDTDEEYTTTLTFTSDTKLVSSETSLDTTYDLVERNVQFNTEEIDDEDTVVVRAEENATVSGGTSVAPGTEGVVRVKSTGSSPFLMTEDVEVQDDGTFAADFDFEGVNPDTNFSATVKLDQNTNAQAPGVVQPAKEASVNIESQNVTAGDNQTVAVKAARLSHGGFITIHDSTLLDGEALSSVRGTSDYIETDGADDVVKNIEVTLDEPYTEDGTAIAMAHQDTNDNEQYDFVTSEGEDDGPYTENGEAVVDSADLTVEEEADATASVAIHDQTSDGSTVTVASASLSEGGFVTIHDSSLNDGKTLESVRGTSDYLEAGNASDIEVTLDEPYTEDGTAIAMAHQDTNDNEQYDFVTSEGEDDGPYTDADGNIVLDDASLTVGDDGADNGTDDGADDGADDGTDDGADDGTATPTQTVDDSDETTTEADGPGFGIVAALIALIAAALVAVRRD